MKLIIPLFLLFLVSPHLYGQITFRLQDAETGKPVEGAQILLTSLYDQAQEIVISNAEGQGSSSLKLPVFYKVSHLAFENIQDTLKTESLEISLQPANQILEELVVTGQFQPQSIDQAVHTVKVIDRDRIEAQGAVDLADVLSNNLNITLTPSKATGRTSVSMLGLEGQYVKILIDGLPFPSVDGNGNNVDITQINLNNVERIEIVEGPMAVNYGANATAGVINIITKTPGNNFSNRISIQEETVGNEYGLNQGRHIQSIVLGHQFKNGLFLQTDFQRNDFRGFLNGFQGEDHTGTDFQRGYDWHPKLQHLGSARVGYLTSNLRAEYRFSYFHQRLDIRSRVVFPDEHPSSGIKNPFAQDNRVSTRRFAHNFLVAGKLGQVDYNISTVYTGVKMEDRTFRYRILTDVEEETTNSEISFLNALTSRGNFTNFIANPKLDFELGYEYTRETMESANVDGGKRSLDNLAGFASIEWAPISALTIRPGLRTFYNSQFSAPLIYSLNMKYEAPFNLDIRASFGRSYRTPNLTELFFYFVDANHDVRGNPDLIPEDGYGASLDLKKTTQFGKVITSNTLKVFYNDVSDQITLGIVNQNPLQFRYINIERFKSKGISLSNRLVWNQLELMAGFSYIGRFNDFSEEDSDLAEFLYSPEFNFNATYILSKPNLRFAAFYKHTGRVEQYVLDDETNTFRKGKTNAFNWLDFTTTWSATQHLEFQGGARNILDLRDIQTTTGQAGAHSDAPTSVGLTYGRSYFLRASYIF